MTKLEQLKKEIQRLRPEIMELKFGCVIKYGGIIEIITHNPASYYHSQEQDEIIGFATTHGNREIGIDKKTKKHYWYGVSDKSFEPEILGRPITLEDVLAVLGNKLFNLTIIFSDNRWLLCSSDIENDIIWLPGKSIDYQSEETINFLHSLIVN